MDTHWISLVSVVHSTTIDNNYNNHENYMLWLYYIATLMASQPSKVQVWVPCEFDVWSTQRVTLVGGDRSHLEPHLAEEAA